MVVIGVDSYKRTHAVVAVDEPGRKLAERTVDTTAEGHLELLTWSPRWPERTWALEDCRHLTRRLEADLIKAGGSPAGADQTHGRRTTVSPRAGQERPNQRTLSRSGGPARTEPAYRRTRWRRA